MPIPLPTNGHSNEGDSTDPVNLDQIQVVQNYISPEVNSNISEQIVNTSFDNAPNSEDKEINDFLDQKVKEKVSNMMRDINREKKLLRSKEDPTSRTQEALLSSQDTPSIESEQMPIDQNISEAPINQTQGIISSEIMGASTTVLKIPYNQKVEQGLTHELSVCAEDNDIENNAIHGFSSDKPFNTQIPGLSLEIILTESKLGILGLEKIDDRSARTSVYNEIKSLLPDITDNAHMIEPFISNDSEKLPETE
nr:2835_t:CDS:2 [Entrophospora candida]